MRPTIKFWLAVLFPFRDQATVHFVGLLNFDIAAAAG